MKIDLACLSLLLTQATIASAFVAPQRLQRTAPLYSSSSPPPTTESTTADTTTIVADNNNNDINNSKTDDSGGLPWWWELVWKMDMMKRGESGQDIVFGDTAHVLRTNIEQIYGNYPSLDGCPLAEGEMGDIAEGTMFVGLQNYFQRYGSPYKLCFGPKSFLVISDPLQAKHVLREASTSYDKGMLGELLEPIMGKGLIPADPVTWRERRPQIVPAFHKAWLEHMVGLFGYCNEPLVDKLNNIADSNDGKVDMEQYFNSVALDIIGLSVFNFKFGSVTNESPIIKSVYSTLVEVEHRSMTPAPYWDLPFANLLVPRLRKFNSDLKLLNEVLDDLIIRAKQTRSVTDIEELEKRNYAEVTDPSMLRFLVDMRGADIDNKQLRDDLMTMLIAGHETTGALLTWSLFELTRNPDCLVKVREELDRVLGDGKGGHRDPTYADIQQLPYVRLVLAETLRMYPEPPLLIRRCRAENTIPKGGGASDSTCIRGMDLFLAIYNIHRDPRYWPEPDKFDPDRFTRAYKNPDIPEWAGFDPAKWQGKLYPNEIASDFAYLPFGGGARKCVGDEFAVLEAVVTLSMVVSRFDFKFDADFFEGKENIMDHPQHLNHPVGIRTGATIHTRNGLNLIVKRRTQTGAAVASFE